MSQTVSSTALDIITGGLLNINSYSPAETLSASDGQVALGVLNDLLDSLSNEEAYVYCQQEYSFPWVGGQYSYTVGNPVGGTFVGALAAGSPTITVTSLPANLVANTTVGMGSTLTDLAAQIPTGTALFPVATTVIATTATTITMSANALATVASDTITYTVPGNIPMNRPLRFRSGFSRSANSGSSSLDYTFTFTDLDNYKRELLKNNPGPWPYIATYNPAFPYGKLFVYPAPTASYIAHLFSDFILTQFATINTSYLLPQGYSRSLKKLLALELAPIYGKSPSPELKMQAKEAKELLKGTNSTPSAVLQYDSALMNVGKDASFIVNGGFS